MYVTRDSFFFLLYLHKAGYGSVGYQSFKHNKSLISPQDLPDVIASVIKVCVKPLDFA